jgi:hypothetical protein
VDQTPIRWPTVSSPDGGGVNFYGASALAAASIVVSR